MKLVLVAGHRICGLRAGPCRPLLLTRVGNDPSLWGKQAIRKEGAVEALDHAMDVLDESDALRRRSDRPRAQSARVRDTADEKMEKSRRLIAAAHEAVMRAHGREPTGPER